MTPMKQIPGTGGFKLQLCYCIKCEDMVEPVYIGAPIDNQHNFPWRKKCSRCYEELEEKVYE